jgi:ElaB/YqjD/DUF883 family membrane-anchored ribosome-binding protein
MLTAPPSSVVQKRDLHVGGLGSSATGALAAVTDPLGDAAHTWLRRAQEGLRDADEFVHDKPWAALGIVAVLGVAAGYLLAQRRA